MQCIIITNNSAPKHLIQLNLSIESFFFGFSPLLIKRSVFCRKISNESINNNLLLHLTSYTTEMRTFSKKEIDTTGQN